MADTSLLTRCPHCDTRFRVTDEQLSVAGGKVRCGHCMDVFDARAHSISDTPAATPGSAPPSDEPDLIFQDNPEEDAVEGRYAGGPVSFDDDELSDSFRGFGDDADSDDENAGVDESWAEAMLREFESEPGLSADPQERNDRRPPPTQPTRTPTPPAPATRQPEYTREDEDIDYGELAPGFEPQVDVRSDDRAGTTPSAKRQPKPAAAGGPEGWSLTDEPTGATDQQAATSDPARFTARNTTSDPATVHERASGAGSLQGTPYDQLGRDPVAVRGRSGGGRGWLWSLVALALLAGLVSQVVWFQFDRLSAIPELRPWYERACALAGCQLQPLTALDRIQSRQLVVRTDPQDRNALLVDAVIINQAEFEQPFPAIALTFSNLNGDVVAQSVFPPSDYLAGDGQSLGSMPPGTPVRIAISIRDPGRDAVNYNLRFVPARPSASHQAAR